MISFDYKFKYSFAGAVFPNCGWLETHYYTLPFFCFLLSAGLRSVRLWSATKIWNIQSMHILMNMKYLWLKSCVACVMWFSDEDDGYYVARVAIYNTGIIICQVLPLAMMYIFSRDIIHSATADIYYCHDCARVKQHWKNDLSLWISETVREPFFSLSFLSLLNHDTVFLVSLTNQSGFTTQSQAWNLFTATGLHLTASSLAQQRQHWEHKWQHLTGEPNDCLHCWNSGLTSWVCPHWPTANTHFSLIFPFPSFYQVHM